jgi:hypothetical protein
VVVVGGDVVVVVVAGAPVVVVVDVVGGAITHISSKHGVAQQPCWPAPEAEQWYGVPTSQQWPLASHSRVTGPPAAVVSTPQHSPSGPSQQRLYNPGVQQ